MTPPADALQNALAGRYQIARELGQGGMATVYLAEDVKHRRKVVSKVLRPALGAALGAAPSTSRGAPSLTRLVAVPAHSSPVQCGDTRGSRATPACSGTRATDAR